MARFLAAIEGKADEATRLGSPSSGIRAQAQGWDIGVKVMGCVNSNDRDEFAIYMTGGSNGWVFQTYIGRVCDTSNGPIFEPELTYFEPA